MLSDVPFGSKADGFPTTDERTGIGAINPILRFQIAMMAFAYQLEFPESRLYSTCS